MAPGLHIVHIITEGRPMGGAQLNTLHSMLYQQREHRVELLVGTDGPLVETSRQRGIPTAIVDMRNRLFAPVADVLALFRLVQALRVARPDVVHTHSSKAGILGRLAARIAGVPVVVHTVHGEPFHAHHGVPARWVLKAVERFWVRLTDQLIAVADTIRDEYVRSGACGPERIATVVSGIDLAVFPADRQSARARGRLAAGITDGRFVVVSVGHLRRNKGHDLLIRATAALRSLGEDVGVLVVGDGEDRDRLQQMVGDLGLADRVVLMGPRDDVPDLLAASDVFVQTSWREGLSRSLVEAMYSHLPVVATDVGATREIVRDGVTGYLIAPDDTETLVNRLLLLIRDEAARAAMGNEAHRLVGESRSVDAMGADLDALYRSLAGASMQGGEGRLVRSFLTRRRGARSSRV